MRKWEELPKYMQCEEVKEYYDILSKRKLSLKMKRLFDIIAGIGVLIVTAIPMLIISIKIAAESPGGVFYRQERITTYGKKFKIHKFRTMVANADQIGTTVTVSGDSRITPTGKFLRKYRLDELPQVFDVIAGNMSFVGTRPEATKYVKKYTKEMRATLLMPAGITSEASIRYKDEAKMLNVADDVDKVYVEKVLPAKMKYNLQSIREFSFFGEIRTMIRTVLAVAGKEIPKKVKMKNKKIMNKTTLNNKVKKKKPLIALLTNNDDDVYCFRKELIEGLLADGYEMLISCPNGPKFEMMKDIPYIYDDPIIDRRGTNVIADSKLFLHYRKLFKKYKPDVVLTYTAKPNVYASIAARQFGIPYINNVTGLGSVLNKKGFIRSFIMFLFKTAYRGAACVMFQNSTNMQLALNAGMIKGDYKLIPGSGVDTDRYPLQTYPDGGNGIDGNMIVFNYIGRILHDKGVDDYIEAAKRIKKNFPNTEFNMIGFIEPTENHYKKDLEDLGKQGIVRYHGSQKDVKPFIKRAHAIIHPSTYGEGMSNVLLENASSGRFIITTDNPGCQETVINEETGFIYHGGNVDDLVKKIEKFLAMENEKRKTMGQIGRQYVKENFSRSIVVETYKEKIKEILL